MNKATFIKSNRGIFINEIMKDSRKYLKKFVIVLSVTIRRTIATHEQLISNTRSKETREDKEISLGIHHEKNTLRKRRTHDFTRQELEE